MAQVQLGPPVVDLIGVRAGDRNEVSIALTVDGSPWNLTGATITAQARAQVTDVAVGLTATITPVDLAAGTFRLSWNGDAVRTLLGSQATWSGVWDLQVLASGGTLPETAVEGKITCVMDVTRP